MNKKEVVVFRKKLQPLEEITLTERVKANGTIEGIKLRFYIGQEMNLKVLPYIKHIGNKIEYFISSPTNDYFLSGDDDNLTLDVVVPVNYDDEIVVKAINTNTEFEYNLVCDVIVDYYQGTNRVVGGVV